MSWNTLTDQQRQHLHTILTPRQLQVVQDRLNGHTWSRIARAMNLDEATVRGHHKRALRAIANTRKETP